MSDIHGPGKRSSYHHGDLRRALIKAALRLIAEEGASSFTLREVARRAGVSHTAPYRHFTDKLALLAAVAEEGFRTLRARMVALGAKALDDPLTYFQTLGVEYVRFAVEHPSYFRVMFGPDIADRVVYPALHEAAQGTFALLTKAIAAGQQARVVRSGDPHTLALIAWAQVHGLATLLVDRRVAVTGSEHMVELAAQSARLLYEGLRGEVKKHVGERTER